MDGFGPVYAEVGRDRIKAAEQISAEENLHGDSVWMSWHVAALADGPTIHQEVAVISTDVLESRSKMLR